MILTTIYWPYVSSTWHFCQHLLNVRIHKLPASLVSSPQLVLTSYTKVAPYICFIPAFLQHNSHSCFLGTRTTTFSYSMITLCFLLASSLIHCFIILFIQLKASIAYYQTWNRSSPEWALLHWSLLWVSPILKVLENLYIWAAFMKSEINTQLHPPGTTISYSVYNYIIFLVSPIVVKIRTKLKNI